MSFYHLSYHYCPKKKRADISFALFRLEIFLLTPVDEEDQIRHVNRAVPVEIRKDEPLNRDCLDAQEVVLQILQCDVAHHRRTGRVADNRDILPVVNHAVNPVDAFSQIWGRTLCSSMSFYHLSYHYCPKKKRANTKFALFIL